MRRVLRLWLLFLSADVVAMGFCWLLMPLLTVSGQRPPDAARDVLVMGVGIAVYMLSVSLIELIRPRRER